MSDEQEIWSVDMESISRQWTNSVSISDGKGGHVCHLTRGYECDANGDSCPSFANARLIAAAPMLLEALEFLFQCTDPNHPDDPSDENPVSVLVHQAREDARTAIGKVKAA